MNYKTIVMEMLEQRPQLYQALRKDHKLLTAIDLLAMELKTSHEQILLAIGPETDKESFQANHQAFDLALKELEDRLPPLLSMGRAEELSLDQAMTFLRVRQQR